MRNYLMPTRLYAGSDRGLEGGLDGGLEGGRWRWAKIDALAE